MILDEFLSARISVAADGCWHWTGPINKAGYSRFVKAGRERAAHRVTYELANGPIPPGLVLDHLCHSRGDCKKLDRDCLHRRCVNPAHLEAVTPRENVMRSWSPSALNAQKTRCPKGHPYDERNLYRVGRGRLCRYCTREEVRQGRAHTRIRTGPRGPRVAIVERNGDELRLACGHTVYRHRAGKLIQAAPRALCEHCDRELLAEVDHADS